VGARGASRLRARLARAAGPLSALPGIAALGAVAAIANAVGARGSARRLPLPVLVLGAVARSCTDSPRARASAATCSRSAATRARPSSRASTCAA
jgi:hypothetical protein